MAPERTLYYSHNLNPRVAVAVARHLKVPLALVRADPMGKDQEWMRPLNPNTLAPVLVEDGRSLWETDAIAMRLSAISGADFWPQDRQEEIMMWVSWSAHHFIRAAGVFTFENLVVPQFMNRPPNASLLAAAAQDIRRYGRILDDHLAGRTWLVGDRLSYADFRAATPLPFAGPAAIPMEEFGNIARWHDRLNALDAWREPFAGID